MISQIYNKYFQKSFTFLYPILGFKKDKHPRPVQTYLSWAGTAYKESSRKLICVYKKSDDEKWKTFEREYLITHKMLDMCVPLDNDQIVYIFDFNSMADDYDAVVEGKYSKMSSHVKKLLGDYYGIHTPEWVYIESFVFPAKYFKQYSQILDVEEDFLRSVGELCDKVDFDKETLTIECPEELEFINN
jgi:hypothetical protein